MPSPSRPALLQIQRWLRGAYERRHRGTLPIVAVRATVTSPTSITCIAPPVLSPGRVHVVISFNGKDFEWASTEHIQDLWGTAIAAAPAPGAAAAAAAPASAARISNAAALVQSRSALPERDAKVRPRQPEPEPEPEPWPEP